MRVNYAVVYVSDMERSVLFYRDVLDLPLRFETPGWTEFATEGVTLALHASDGTSTEKQRPEQLTPGSCRPGFCVADLDAFHTRMIERSVRCIQVPRDVFGSRIAQYVDPDGLTIAVSETRKPPVEATR